LKYSLTLCALLLLLTACSTGATGARDGDGTGGGDDGTASGTAGTTATTGIADDTTTTGPTTTDSTTGDTESGEDVGVTSTSDDGQPEDSGPGFDGEVVCQCDDNNPCTEDVCLDDGSCTNELVKVPECAPSVTIDVPPRASTLYSAPVVDLSGTVSAPIGPSQLVANGAGITPEDGLWGQGVEPVHGINVLRAEVTDGLNVKRRAVQAFLLGQAFYPTTKGDSPDAAVNNGMFIYLGKETWDALADLTKVVLDDLDLSALLQQTLVAEGQGPSLAWCEWNLAIDDISFYVQKFELIPVTGGIALIATIKELSVDFAATDPTFLCIDAVGVATTDTITLSAVLWVDLGEDGEFTITADEVQAVIAPPTIDFTKGFLSLVDWFINWFNGPLASLLSSQLETVIQEQIAPLIQQVFDGFANDGMAFDVPSFMGVTTPVTVTFGMAPTWLNIDQTGAKLAMGVRVTANQGLPSDIASPGSLARNGCLHGEEQAVAIPAGAPMSLGLHDDLLNQLMFAAWWGGAIHLTLPETLIESLMSNVELALTNVKLTLDPRLPPVITSCTDSGNMELHLGDMRLDVQFDLAEKPASAELYLSAKVEVVPTTVLGEDGNLNVALEIADLVAFEYQLVAAGGIFEGVEAGIDTLLGNVLVDMLMEQIAAGFTPSFPIPSIDIGGIVEGLPPGTTISLSISDLSRKGAYTVLSGGLK